jgi:hypothetical protein
MDSKLVQPGAELLGAVSPPLFLLDSWVEGLQIGLAHEIKAE